MSRFKEGQKLVCINDKWCLSSTSSTDSIDKRSPIKGDIVIIRFIRDGFFSLEGYEYFTAYSEIMFAPLKEDRSTSKLTLKIEIEVLEALELETIGLN